MEVAEQLLQPQEVPRGLRGVRREVGVRDLTQGRVQERREHEEPGEEDEHRDELLEQEMRPHVDAVALLTLDPLDPFRRHEGEQPVLLRGALLRGWDPACRQRRIAPRHGGGCGRDGGRRRGSRRSWGRRGRSRGRGNCRCRGSRCRRACRGTITARRRCRAGGPRRMRLGRVWIRVVVGADRLRSGTPLGDASVGSPSELGIQRLLVHAHVLRDFLPGHPMPP